jgi:hypothetical protein
MEARSNGAISMAQTEFALCMNVLKATLKNKPENT